MSTQAKQLTPRLVVGRAAQAIEFYVKALGASELGRHADPELGGHIVHAELKVGDDVRFTLTEEQPEWGNHSPQSLGGTPVILTLDVTDADAVGRRMQAAGAEVVFPIADQFYGRREGRLRDPFGHLWIISQPLA
jgi:PhnB protein